MDVKRLKGKVTKWVDLENECMTPHHPYFTGAKANTGEAKSSMQMEEQGLVTVHVNVTKPAFHKVTLSRSVAKYSHHIPLLIMLLIIFPNDRTERTVSRVLQP